MSAFIRLNKQDAFVVPYTAHKSYLLSSTALSGSGGWQFYYGTKNTSSLFSTAEISHNSEFDRLIFSSINHLYYSNYVSASVESGSYFNYNQTTLFQSRSISQAEGDHVFVLSATRQRTGEGIYPTSFKFYSGSFAIVDDGEGGLYASSSVTLPTVTSASIAYAYVSESLRISAIDDPTPFIQFTGNTSYGTDVNYTLVQMQYLGDSATSPFYVNTVQQSNVDPPAVAQAYFSAPDTLRTYDTNRLNYADNSSTNNDVQLTYTSASIVYTTVSPSVSLTTGEYVGNIFYPHGIGVITHSNLAAHMWYKDQYSSSIAWKNSHTIFQHEYRCRVREGELNFSQNPTIKSGSNGDMYGFATASYFQPYITSVGLYNDASELVGVAKLSQPVPKSKFMDMNFVVKFDI